MEKVEPIRSKDEIQAIGEYLLKFSSKDKKADKKTSYRNYMMFTIGCNTSFRISDLLSLTVKQAREQTHIRITAKKTKKKAVIAIGNIAEIIDQYAEGMSDDEYLFKSIDRPELQSDGKHWEWHEIRKTTNGKTIVTDRVWQPSEFQPDSTGHMPISRVQAWRILNAAADNVGLDYRFGTHSMRKTFAYWYYQETKDVATLMRVLGHSTERQTLEYIGINQDVVDDKMSKFVISTCNCSIFENSKM